jgi:protein-S-isoprenylcysteine O-methyltransferase Ste14
MLVLILWLGVCVAVTLIARLKGQRSLANLTPAYLFAFPLAVYAWGFATSTQGGPLSSEHDVAGALQHIVTIAFYGLLVVLFAARSPVSGARASVTQQAVALGGTFTLVAAGFLPIAQATSTELLLASSGLVMLGTLIAFWGLATLGRCFGLFPEVRGLVMRGPYRLVRHPAYLGEIVASVGFLLSRPHIATLILVLLFILLQYWRTIFEERILAAAFPDEYPAYRAIVPRLVPGLRAGATQP